MPYTHIWQDTLQVTNKLAIIYIVLFFYNEH